MWKHNILLALRSFRRNRSSFVINLVGLSTGIACALLIYFWVNSELQMDKFHQHDQQLYKVMINQFLPEETQTWHATPDRLADALVEEIPEVEMSVSVMPASEFGDAFTLSAGKADKYKTSGQFASADFFNVFDFPLIAGEPDKVLQDKNAIVLSETLAEKIFGSAEQALGKTLDWSLIGYKSNALVTGIYQELPAQATQQFDFVITYIAWLSLSEAIGRGIHWDNYGPRTFLVTHENISQQVLNDKTKDFLQTKNPQLTAQLLPVKYSSLYLYGNFENGRQQSGRIIYVRMFTIVAIFILLIACINFMNLSTARASRRIKEIGVKKTIGANRKLLVTQFLGESIILSIVAMVVAIFLIVLLLPQFNLITGKQLTFNLNFSNILVLLSIALVTGLLAGSYPALYLSGFSPSSIFSRRASNSHKEVWLRKGLVVFQFSLSVILILGVIIVYQQLDFIQNKNLGYNKDNIIYFDNEGKVAENQDVFLQKLKKLPGIENASSANTNLMGPMSSTMGVHWPGKDEDANPTFETVMGNYEMIETLQLNMLEGRSYLMQRSNEEEKVIFNQAAIETMGMTDPIGATVTVWGEEKTIIGVVENFHFESFYENIRPAVILLRPSHTMNMLVRIEAGRAQEALAGLQSLYQQFNPGYPLNYKFLNQEYQQLYDAEQKVSVISRYFAGLAILISCLGLFGLATYTAERRIKEIGIRKILGASVFGIVGLLSADFTKMVILAIVLALPFSFYFGQQWLDNFAFSIELQWWYFAIAGLLALVIAWLTVGMQTYRAARVNPTKCLKKE